MTLMTALLVILLSAVQVPLWAAKKTCTLVVLTKDNAQHQFVLLTDKPKVTFEGSNLKVTCAKVSASATFKLSDVLRFTYVNLDPTGITEATEDSADVSYQDGMLVISQVRAGAVVGVYALDGKLVKQLKAQHAGTYRLNLSGLPFGVYIVKADNVTYKITRR